MGGASSTAWRVAKFMACLGLVVAVGALLFGRTATMSMSNSLTKQWGWGTGVAVVEIPHFFTNLQKGMTDAGSLAAPSGDGTLAPTAPTGSATQSPEESKAAQKCKAKDPKANC